MFAIFLLDMLGIPCVPLNRGDGVRPVGGMPSEPRLELMTPGLTSGEGRSFFYGLPSRRWEDGMEQMWYTAAAWLGLAFLASLISMRIGISVALMRFA